MELITANTNKMNRRAVTRQMEKEFNCEANQWKGWTTEEIRTALADNIKRRNAAIKAHATRRSA
jgi:hypothetical protein